jgi:CRISPR-associated protein Cmr1
MIKERKYQLTFTTPAFLGDAEQNGRWRTPPFKAQLRQWWRVAYAAKQGFSVNVASMRREEGLLFGNAWLQDEFCKSRVRLRLDRWEDGTLTRQKWTALSSVSHPEVRMPVDSGLYLGYGPVALPRGASKATLKANAAIQVGESATLSLAYPEEAAHLIEQALWLMHRYGTVGGRSRNGWGSYELSTSPPGGGDTGEGVPLRNWRECLDLDWPHAIGKDERGPLIWQTESDNDWKSLMRTLAIIKIGLRTQFVFPSVAPPHPSPLPRHWLSYPITRHTTTAFDRNARLPNSLRVKVRKMDSGKLVGVIFHMPCLPPPAFAPNKAAIFDTWKKVHELLDELTRPATARRYTTITDASRRASLKPSLDSVSLQRIPE